MVETKKSPQRIASFRTMSNKPNGITNLLGERYGISNNRIHIRFAGDEEEHVLGFRDDKVAMEACADALDKLYPRHEPPPKKRSNMQSWERPSMDAALFQRMRTTFLANINEVTVWDDHVHYEWDKVLERTGWVDVTKEDAAMFIEKATAENWDEEHDDRPYFMPGKKDGIYVAIQFGQGSSHGISNRPFK